MSGRYPDVRKAGRAKRVHFKRGESAEARHARRLRENLDHEQEMAEWCAARQVSMNVKNYGHHWQFRMPWGLQIDWWPSRAKLVIGQRWSAGIHVHDWVQVQEIIAKKLEAKP